jgi:hypothetical protein
MIQILGILCTYLIFCSLNFLLKLDAAAIYSKMNACTNNTYYRYNDGLINLFTIAMVVFSAAVIGFGLYKWILLFNHNSRYFALKLKTLNIVELFISILGQILSQNLRPNITNLYWQDSLTYFSF